MKQFQIAYEDDKALLKEIDNIGQWQAANPSYATLFRIYSDDMNTEHITHVCDILEDKMPDALYLGCTSNANILDGSLIESSILIICTVSSTRQHRQFCCNILLRKITTRMPWTI